MPFLVLGVLISAAIAAFVPAGLPAARAPRPAGVLAVPVAAVAGAALPGCECGSVPIAGRLVSRGAPAAAALTFLLSAPAINPVVLVSTAVAFPGEARRWSAPARREPARSDGASGSSGLASAATSCSSARGSCTLTKARQLSILAGTAQHDLLHAGGFLIIGAATAATLQTVVPRDVLDTRRR